MKGWIREGRRRNRLLNDTTANNWIAMYESRHKAKKIRRTRKWQCFANFQGPDFASEWTASDLHSKSLKGVGQTRFSEIKKFAELSIHGKGQKIFSRFEPETVCMLRGVHRCRPALIELRVGVGFVCSEIIQLKISSLQSFVKRQGGRGGNYSDLISYASFN